MGHGHDPKHGRGHHGKHAHVHARPGETSAHGESSAREHRSTAPTHVACFVLTCSDSRAQADDVSGRVLREGLEAAGHAVVGQSVVRDEPEAIRVAVEGGLEGGARAVLITGGTGITRRDQTVEAVRPLLDKEIPGFGELFRMLSFEEIGSAAWLSRALAGTMQGALVFVLPGSPNAVRLALDRLILPELGHAVRELSR